MKWLVTAGLFGVAEGPGSSPTGEEVDVEYGIPPSQKPRRLEVFRMSLQTFVGSVRGRTGSLRPYIG